MKLPRRILGEELARALLAAGIVTEPLENISAIDIEMRPHEPVIVRVSLFGDERLTPELVAGLAPELDEQEGTPS